MLPKTLNRVQLRTVLGQKQREQLVLQQRESGLGRLTAMDRAIVQNDDQRSSGRVLMNQVFQESNEGFTVACWRHLVDELVGDPVVSTKDVLPLLLSWRRNAFLTTPFHPTSHQHRQGA